MDCALVVWSGFDRLAGRYGNGARNLLPEWLDIATVILFALSIFYWAGAVANSQQQAAAAIDKDAGQ